METIMSYSPLVSIIIPCFNRERYIQTAIDSAMSQTYGNIEVIVVDDGSTDNSVSVISSLYGSNVTLITQKNKGVSAARNTGFRAASGEYVVFLDSDDWISEDLIECHVKMARTYQEVDIFCSDFKGVDEKGEIGPLNRINWPDEPGTPVELFLLYPPPFPACEMYKAATVRKFGGYDEDMKGFADSTLRLNIILSNGKVVRTKGGFGVYRRVENSITKSGRLHYYAVKLIKKLLEHPEVQSDSKLKELINLRLVRHRLRIWRDVLSFHTQFNVSSIPKFLFHLFNTMKMDPGYLLFIVTYKPWKKSSDAVF